MSNLWLVIGAVAFGALAMLTALYALHYLDNPGHSNEDAGEGDEDDDLDS